MHQCTRDRKEDGTVIANEEDYKVVRDLVEPSLAQGLNKAVSPEIRAVVEVVEKLLGPRKAVADYDKVSQRQIADELKKDRGSVSRHVRSAIHDGFLVDFNPGQGKESDVRLGERELPNGEALPKPEVLFPKKERT